MEDGEQDLTQALADVAALHDAEAIEAAPDATTSVDGDAAAQPPGAEAKPARKRVPPRFGRRPPPPRTPDPNVLAASKPRPFIGGPGAPFDLPENTELIPRPQYIPLAAMRSRLVQTTFVICALLLMTSSWPLAWFLPKKAIVIAVWPEAMIFYLIILWTILGKTSNVVWVLRKTKWGETKLDRQKWWRWEERKWPDSWRRKTDGRRSLWIDATRGPKKDQLTPATVWIRPLPVRPAQLAARFRFFEPAQARLAAFWAEAMAARGMLDTRDPLMRAIQQGAFVIVTCIALSAIYLGAVRVSEDSKRSSAARVAGISAAQAAEIREQVRKDLIEEFTPKITPTPLQPFGPIQR